MGTREREYLDKCLDALEQRSRKQGLDDYYRGWRRMLLLARHGKPLRPSSPHWTDHGRGELDAALAIEALHRRMEAS